MGRNLAATVCLLVVLTATLRIAAQNSGHSSADDSNASTDSGSQKPPYERNPALTFLRDQKDIWTSPARIRRQDFKWLVPFAGITSGLIATDGDSSYAIGRGVHCKRAGNFSDAALMTAAGSAAGTYLWGRFTDNAHMRETGFLAGEAMTSAFASTNALKFVFERNRPFEQHQRQFFEGGTAFPSGHSAVAWSFASVVAHEYPNPLMQIAAYGSASAVSMARVYSRDHSLSDVFVGAALGYGIGTHIYHARHVDTDNFGSFVKQDTESELSPDRFGSPDVPLGSWIYPALERLVAMGYVDRAFLGLRPWTRLECARMLQEANESAGGDGDAPPDIARFLGELNREFASERRELGGDERESIELESVYTRVTGIAGDPVNDSYHLGQTMINDYGRPFQSGFNNISGFSSRAHAGRFSFVVNGEHQHAPGAGALPLAARQAIATADGVALQPALPVAESNQFRLLDTYVAMNLLGQQISVGKQSLWWGPDEGDAMIMSNNAQPIWMLRINTPQPFRVPLLSKVTGPFRVDNFFGALSGHTTPPHVYMHGQKVSFKPTPNLELGFSRTAVFAGDGHVPLTFSSYWRSFSSFSNVSSEQKMSRRDPGARHANFDFSYRLPYLRDWVTIYSDSLVHDDVSAISAPHRAAWNPGVYISHLPRLPKLDLRVEAVNTDPPAAKSVNGDFLYWEYVYKDAYINRGNLMGSWIGREGKGYQGWSTYWFSPRNSLQLGYRYAKVAKDFIPGGTTQADYSAKTTFMATPQLSVKLFAQYENWLIPVLASNRKSNFTSYVELTFSPGLSLKH